MTVLFFVDLLLQNVYCEPFWLFANRANKIYKMCDYDDWKHIVLAIDRTGDIEKSFVFMSHISTVMVTWNTK